MSRNQAKKHKKDKFCETYNKYDGWYSDYTSNIDLSGRREGMRAFGESLSREKAPQRASIRIVEKVAVLQ